MALFIIIIIVSIITVFAIIIIIIIALGKVAFFNTNRYNFTDFLKPLNLSRTCQHFRSGVLANLLVLC